MRALQHVLDGDLEKARQLLEGVPAVTRDEELSRIQAGLQTLSEVSRALDGNRAERRAAVRNHLVKEKPGEGSVICG
jgi:thioredoxin-like negative regulator of GroEL